MRWRQIQTQSNRKSISSAIPPERSCTAIFLGALKGFEIKAKSVHLWAPTCTAGFATQTYGAAFSNGTANPKSTFVGVLTDKNETADSCVPGAYSKSLLYLVSRALEPDHKTPVIGMQKCWKEWWPPKNDDFFNGEKRIQDGGKGRRCRQADNRQRCAHPTGQKRDQDDQGEPRLLRQ